MSGATTRRILTSGVLSLLAEIRGLATRRFVDLLGRFADGIADLVTIFLDQLLRLEKVPCVEQCHAPTIPNTYDSVCRFDNARPPLTGATYAKC